MTNSVTMCWNNCANCFHQVVEYLKAADEICDTCFKTSCKGNQFPNWKQVKQ